MGGAMNGIWSVLFPGRWICRCADALSSYHRGNVSKCYKCGDGIPYSRDVYDDPFSLDFAKIDDTQRAVSLQSGLGDDMERILCELGVPPWVRRYRICLL